MRSKNDVDDYAQKARLAITYKCQKCSGADVNCECHKRLKVVVSAYEACIPRDFWGVKSEDIDHNVEVFNKVILKYVAKFATALKKGYGLVLLGDNGTGKTTFASYVLMSAIQRGFSAYYTTLPQLEHAIKNGFDDKAVQRRLDWMLTSDFLVIDEMGKEKYRRSGVKQGERQSTFMDANVERILKQRCDDSMPTILATNMSYKELLAEYGTTIGSIIAGKSQPVLMKSGDYRKKLTKRMKKDMGY